MGRPIAEHGVNPDAPSPNNVHVALRGLCPRCREGGIFRNPLEYKESCPVCHFDLKQHDNGDGPAFFVIIIVGFLVTALAGWVEYSYQPPFWLHAVVWGPLILLTSVILLRFFKGWMLAAQYTRGLLGDDHD